MPDTMHVMTIAGDSGSTTLAPKATVTHAGGTDLTSIVAGNTVTHNHDAVGTAGTYATPASITTNATGHISAVTAGWTHVIKTADETVQNDATVNVDNTLVFPLAVANKNYAFKLVAFFDTTAAGDFAYQHGVANTAAARTRIRRKHTIPGTAAGTDAFTEGVDVAASGADITIIGTGTIGGYIELEGVLTAGNATNGVWQFKWSQDTADNNPGTKVLAGSWLRWKQVD